jgi:DNA-binding MarR family transcriptional regulator
MDRSNKALYEVLHEWSEVFMRRSMQDFIRFSKRKNLSPSQLGTLMQLHHHGACGVSYLGSRLGVTNAAASQLIDRMVQMGLLERSEDPVDRRVKQIALTERGKQFIHEGMQARLAWVAELVEALPPGEQESITGALSLLTKTARSLDRENQQDCPV